MNGATNRWEEGNIKHMHHYLGDVDNDDLECKYVVAEPRIPQPPLCIQVVWNQVAAPIIHRRRPLDWQP